MNTQSYGWRSIRLRLFLLFALVIAAVLFYAVSEVMTQWNTRGAMERGAQYSALSVQINGVVHELQKERGFRPASSVRAVRVRARVRDGCVLACAR